MTLKNLQKSGCESKAGILDSHMTVLLELQSVAIPNTLLENQKKSVVIIG